MNKPAVAFIAYVFVLSALLCRAEDWTVNGKTYKNVTVTKSDAQYVSIMYDGGIGRVALADCSPDIQKKYNYDPQASADAAAQEKARIVESDAAVQKAAQQNKVNEAYAKLFEPPPKDKAGKLGGNRGQW